MTVEAGKTTSFTPSFESEDDEVIQYRSVSALAVVALLLGLASPLCVIAPLLMVIPIVGAVVSFLALRQISESGGALVGRGAAIAGLVLCVVSGVAAVSRTKVTEYLRTQQAEVVAQQWFELLQSGEKEPAFRLTVRGASPPPPASPDTPPDAPAEDPLAEFLHDPVVEAIQSAGQSATVQLVENIDYAAEPRGQYFVRQRFLVTPPKAASGEPFDVTLTLQRARVSGERAMRWLVAAYGSEDLPAADEHGHAH